MAWFRKRKKSEVSFGERVPEGLVDLHSHVLPGLDDGPQTLEESTELLDGMAELGYKLVVATPHFDIETQTPTVERQRGLIEELTAVRGGRDPALLPGAEVPFDERFLPLAREGKLPRLGKKPGYLLEFGFQPGSVPRGIEEVLFRFQIKQGTIVVAHPERIADFHRDMERLTLLIRAGCLLQVDLMSLAGKYGNAAQGMARELLDNGYVHVLASDVHAEQDLSRLESAIAEVLDWNEEAAIRLVATNPRKIVEGLFDEVRDAP